MTTAASSSPFSTVALAATAFVAKIHAVIEVFSTATQIAGVLGDDSRITPAQMREVRRLLGMRQEK